MQNSWKSINGRDYEYGIGLTLEEVLNGEGFTKEVSSNTYRGIEFSPRTVRP